jgi:hypothetical protein
MTSGTSGVVQGREDTILYGDGIDIIVSVGVLELEMERS